MTKRTSLPFGTWPSPISPGMLGAKMRLNDVQFDSDGKTLVWLEGRSGRGVLAAQSGQDAFKDLTDDLSVRAGVGYGGGDFHAHSGQVVFVSAGRLYSKPLGHGRPRPISPAFGDFASPRIAPDSKKVLFVHSYERADSLCLLNLSDSQFPLKLASGADFYMQPVWHPDSQRLAWVEWNHPQMPWDGCRLMSAKLEGNTLTEVKHLAGDENTPVYQPEFSPDGRWLAYIIQDGEWDRLVLRVLKTGEEKTLVKDAALMDPAWIQGTRTFGWGFDSAQIFFLRNDRGQRALWAVNIQSGGNQEINIQPYSWVDQLCVSPVDNQLAFIGSSAQIPERVVLWKDNHPRVVRRADSETISPEDLPSPEVITWNASDGTQVHGLYYPPTSSKNSDNGLPPALVNIHGGPTSARNKNFNPSAAYFASRGFGYMEVNYRGSTGFGRSYMLALRKKWGPVDAEDAVGGARALAAMGYADSKRMVIIGGSAGGFTVLNALIHYPGIFKAGVNLFGVSNLFISETHKFEERYNDSLVGVLPADAEHYKAWSPVFHADKIRDPMAVFQGADDNVVTPAHSEQIVARLRANKIPHIYKLYEGEGHGWRKSETIMDYYTELEKFLREHVLFG